MEKGVSNYRDCKSEGWRREQKRRRREEKRE